MAVLDFPRTTYSDPTAQVRMVTDVISIIDPDDTPIVAYLGGMNGKLPAGWKIVGKGRKVEWFERPLMSLDGALGAAIASTSATSITVTDASIFHVGDIIQIDDEQMWVSARDTTTEVLTVSRGFAGTTAATHSNGTAVKILGNARIEGADSDVSSFTEVTAPYNVTEIYHDEVRISGTEQAIDYYGVSDPVMYETQLKIREILRKLERQIIYGYRNDPSSNDQARAMGGFPQFITGNTESASTLSYSAYENIIKAIWEDGGKPDTLVMSMRNKLRTIALYNNASYLKIDRSEDTVGMNILQVETGVQPEPLKILVSRHMPDDKIYVLTKEHLALWALRPFQWKPLADLGDSTRRELIGEFTFLCRHGDKAHGVITGITG